ncbi:MAG: phytase [Spirochaetales bacterium]|nr:phytase [Spirochaetales bacterium]
MRENKASRSNLILSTTVFAILFLLTEITPLFSQSDSVNVIKPKAHTTPTAERDADDPAVWIDKNDPSRSVIIGSDKDYGYEVWSITGELLQKIPQNTATNNIDLRYNFKLGGKSVDIVAGNLRDAGKLAVFIVNPNYTRGDVLRQIAGKNSSGNNIAKDSYGFTLYRRPSDGSVYVFDRPKMEGTKVTQYLIEDDGTGNGVVVTPVRKLDYHGSVTEGFTADDELGFIYLPEEHKCIHKYYADPDKNNREIATFGYDDGIDGDREGMAIYKCKDGTGYIVLSSQGNSTIKIYERQGNNRFVKTVDPVNDEGDTEMDTDGVDVCNIPVSPLFPEGFLVLHSDPKSMFQIYDWRDVLGNDLERCSR